MRTIRECEREKYLKGIEKLEAYGDLKQVVHKQFKSTLKDEPSNVYVFQKKPSKEECGNNNLDGKNIA